MDDSKEKVQETEATPAPDLAALKREQKEQKEEVLRKFVMEDKSLQEALNLSDDALEYLYCRGYQFYKLGKYKEARGLFHMLYFLKAVDIRFSMGIAACYHMEKDFQNAINWYLMCAAVDGESPLPFYHMTDCFLKMNQKLSAFIALKLLALRVTNDDPKYAMIKERSLRLMDTLSKELSLENEIQESKVNL